MIYNNIECCSHVFISLKRLLIDFHIFLSSVLLVHASVPWWRCCIRLSGSTHLWPSFRQLWLTLSMLQHPT